ncbi:MAG: DUF3108 domain-containing protein [Saezia sp.]
MGGQALKEYKEYSPIRRKLILGGLSVPLWAGLAPTAFAQSPLWKPPAAVKFDYSLNGQYMGSVSGTGTFDWKYSSSNGIYAMELNISAFLMSFFYSSQGRYDEMAGVLPSAYREKRIGRDRTVSFDYPSETLSYRWKPTHDTRPLKKGAQDAISVLMQMIHQMRNGVAELKAGQQLTFPIARMGSVKEWSFSVLGMETVKIKSESYEAWRIKWVSPKGDDATTTEMWLAPRLSYMPVKLSYWSEDGSNLDILLTRIRTFEA